MAAITQTLLESVGDAADHASYTTGSITPSSNKLVLVSIYSRVVDENCAAPTVTGCGLAWTKVVSKFDTATNQGIHIYRARGATPSAGTLTLDWGAVTQTECIWSISEFTNTDPEGGSIVQVGSALDEGTNSGNIVTLSALGSANNATYGSVRAGNAVTEGSGFTEISETTAATRMQTEWKINDNTVDWSWSSTEAYTLAAAVEIKNGVDGAGSTSPSAGPSISPSSSPSQSPSTSKSPSTSPSSSPSSSPSLSPSTSPSKSPSSSPSQSPSASISPSSSPSQSPSASISPSPSAAPWYNENKVNVSITNTNKNSSSSATNTNKTSSTFRNSDKSLTT